MNFAKLLIDVEYYWETFAFILNIYACVKAVKKVVIRTGLLRWWVFFSSEISN